MNKYSLYIAEALTSKVSYDVIKNTSSSFKATAMIGGKMIQFNASDEGEMGWDVDFAAKGFGKSTYGLTGDGVELQVFSFVKAAFEEFIRGHHPQTVVFTADKDGERENRAALYQRMLKRFADSLGYTFEVQRQRDGSTRFTLTKR